jgi:hypothetical protein
MEPVENSAQENYKISDKKATCLLRTKVVEVQNKNQEMPLFEPIISSASPTLPSQPHCPKAAWPGLRRWVAVGLRLVSGEAPGP